LIAAYWDGAASVDYTAKLVHEITSTVPYSKLSLYFNTARLFEFMNDGTLSCDKILTRLIKERTPGAGIRIINVSITDYGIRANTIDEAITDYGVTIEDVLLKDGLTDTLNLEVDGQIRVSQGTYAGQVVTDLSGIATVTFLAHMGTTKPVVILTPELDPGTDTVYAQITGFTTDAAGNYTGFTLQASDDGGKPEPNVTVHYLVIRKSAF